MKKRELPDVGTILIAKHLGKQYEARVVADKNNVGGKAIKYNNKMFPSMTSAALEITKYHVNGWLFWKY